MNTLPLWQRAAAVTIVLFLLFCYAVAPGKDFFETLRLATSDHTIWTTPLLGGWLIWGFFAGLQWLIRGKL